ncbi:hypothetical protein [Runella sp.]|uniref:hypothetical protein n=1 Tax=Runella sp. TaxID=1960881 RepID=UPI003D12D3F8
MSGAGVYGLEGAVSLPRLPTKARESVIDLRRIMYLSAQGNYTVFHLETGEQVLTSLPLCIYATLLEEHGFMRIHNRSADAIVATESALFGSMPYSSLYKPDFT